VRLGSGALPVAVRESDHIRWVFSKPVSVETPGPNATIGEVRQYKDRIEFTVGMWASIVIITGE
jgi:hypothetical protein